ncbi:hypothetical protein MARPU_02970 [Marichromatium purpuratum 984]|uniref:Uncharacterized protein n=1 Tax=Marichromatium purpuratum 984 TaxID=765910 RepID=W0E3D7_MARPU|nr:hypothetical protein MARPU_02970 [Marichromatium purpuratum 984]
MFEELLFYGRDHPARRSLEVDANTGYAHPCPPMAKDVGTVMDGAKSGRGGGSSRDGGVHPGTRPAQ